MTDPTTQPQAQPTMDGATDHPLVQKIMAYQRAMALQAADAGAIFAPDVQYVVPGHNALSGTTTGPAAVMGYFGKLMALSGGSYAISHMTWLVCGDDKVLLQTDNHAVVQGRSLAWKEALVFTFRDGLKSRIEMFQADQLAVDALFGPPAA